MFDTINEDLKNALKSGDKFKLSVLRLVKSALQLEQINKKEDLTDSDVLNVLKKQVKQRNDSIEEFSKLNQNDAVENLKKEIEIISVYLPEEASDEEISKVIDEAFDEINPTSMKEMGLIMNYVKEHLANADSGKVSKIVKERLSN